MIGEATIGALAIAESAYITPTEETDFYFNGYSLATSNIIISSMTVDDAGDVDYNTFNIPRDHGTGFLSKFWRKKTITLTGHLSCTTKGELDLLLDDVKKNLDIVNQGVFKYRSNGIYRQIKATMTKFQAKREHYHLSFVPLVITFETNEPFFYNTVPGTLLANVTTSPHTEDITLLGSEGSKPQLYLAFTSATTVTSASVAINGRTITYTGALVTNDVLLFDSLTRTVSLNSTEVDYT